jgi:hypothetical protein
MRLGCPPRARREGVRRCARTARARRLGMRVTRFEMRDGGSARSAGLRCAQRWIALRAALDCVARSAGLRCA